MRIILLLFPLIAFTHALLAQPVIGLQAFKTGFSNPVDIAHCGDERMFIVEQNGYIRLIDGDGNIKLFMDIDARVQSGGERGLLGLAFHPNYKNNGFFYVNYTNNSGNTRISRFSVTAAPDIADPNSEEILLTINQPFSNHNGGNLEFGPDGYLYIGMGDGGSSNDPQDHGQNPQSLLGKMLRIDVDTVTSYKIPPDNPFINNPGVSDEIWALGLRNPWRFSFDRITGDLWIADVGQGAREEIDFQPASSAGGENYGWKCFEGNNAHLSSIHGCAANFTFPVFDYVRSLGTSVTGGYVYRGCEYPDLFGHYVFCDYGTGNFWTIENQGDSIFQTTLQLQSNSFRYVSFGEDMNGELYVAGLNGTIYRVTEAVAAQLPIIAASPDAAFCPGDTVTLSTQATGFAIYEWLLDGVQQIGTGLQITAHQPGKYTLSVTGNNGCVYSTPATSLIELTPPTVVITAADTAFCEGDSLLLSTGTFDVYAWSDGSASQSIYVNQAGAYEVTVTDSNGCTGSSASKEISAYPAPQPVIQQTGVLCDGNSAELSTGAYANYLWTTLESTQQITIAQEGIYQVTVTDSNGCAGASDTVDVAYFVLPPPSMLPGNSVTQCGDSVVELTTLDAYSEYLWSTGDTLPVLFVTGNGNFNVTVTDSNGCMVISDSVSAAFFPNPPVTEIILSSTIGNLIYAEDSGYQYQWYADGTLLPGDTLRELSAQEGVEYTVELIDENGCRSLSNSYTHITIHIAETILGNVSIQPNPFSSNIILKYYLHETSMLRVRLLDLTGKEIAILLNESHGAGAFSRVLSTAPLNLSAGNYFLEFQSGDFKQTFRIMKM